MKHCYDEYSYLACPHTAIGLKYCFDNPGVSRAVLATAAPHKFPEAIEASGITDYLPPASISQLTAMPTKTQEMKVGEDWLKILADKVKMISAVNSPSKMMILNL